MEKTGKTKGLEENLWIMRGTGHPEQCDICGAICSMNGTF